MEGVNMEHKYHALRTIGSTFRVIGYIILVLTILGALAFCGFSIISGTAIESASQQFGGNSTGLGAIGGFFGGFLGAIFIILYGGLIALMLVAFGEGIYLLIDIEENTRKTSNLIENQYKLPPSEPKPLPPAQ
jgi:hypothetical protein